MKSQKHPESAYFAYKSTLEKATNLQNLLSLSSTKKHKICGCLSETARIFMSVLGDIYLGNLLLLLFQPTAQQSQNQRTSYDAYDLHLFLAERCRGPVLELFLVFNVKKANNGYLMQKPRNFSK